MTELLPTMHMAKVGGSLLVVKVRTSMLCANWVSLSGCSPSGEVNISVQL